MSMETVPEGRVSPRADLWSALAWIAFGLAVAIGAWRMDRLENLNINKYEAPGLVPFLLGAAVVVLGIVLALRALRQGALQPTGAPAPGRGGERLYLALVVGAMLLYSLVLVGHGLPFWLATLLFVTGFIWYFDRERQAALGRGTGRQLLLALVYGVACSAVVSLVFERVFYVRLP